MKNASATTSGTTYPYGKLWVASCRPTITHNCPSGRVVSFVVVLVIFCLNWNGEVLEIRVWPNTCVCKWHNETNHIVSTLFKLLILLTSYKHTQWVLNPQTYPPQWFYKRRRCYLGWSSLCQKKIWHLLFSKCGEKINKELKNS